ncbi:type I restriction endonuclease subunit R, EcoR124 family [Cereibacter ovatus]|uniref:type I restriction endonuclease subunit R, EcoR124 family n=1 Tax=Cereibacter ovatus TaxID=439529 RepID=UPI000BE3B777|nr:hypothetical protein [Cereibacter ovatus]
MIANAQGAAGKENPADLAARRRTIIDIPANDPRMRSNRELIEELIASYLPGLRTTQGARDAVEGFWTERRKAAFDHMVADENPERGAFGKLVADDQFSGNDPMTDDVVASLKAPPSVLKRTSAAARSCSSSPASLRPSMKASVTLATPDAQRQA